MSRKLDQSDEKAVVVIIALIYSCLLPWFFSQTWTYLGPLQSKTALLSCEVVVVSAVLKKKKKKIEMFKSEFHSILNYKSFQICDFYEVIEINI